MVKTSDKLPVLRTYASDVQQAQSPAQPTATPAVTPPPVKPVAIPPLVEASVQPPRPAAPPVAAPPKLTPPPVNPPFSALDIATSPELTVTRDGPRKRPTVVQRPTLPSIPGIENSDKRSVLQDDLHDVIGEAEESVGTIITDTKRDRFKLGPAIATSVGDWLTTKREALTQNSAPAHTVRAPETRKDIIAAAAKESAMVERPDTVAVFERIKDTPTSPLITAVTVKEKAAVPAPSWTHVVDEETVHASLPVTIPPPPEPAAQPVSFQELSQRFTAPTAAQTVPTTLTATVSEPITPPSVPPAAPETSPRPIVPPQPPFPNEIPLAPVPVAPPPTPVTPTVVPDTPEVIPPRDELVYRPAASASFVRSPLMVVVVMVFAVVTGVGGTVWWLGIFTPEPPTSPTATIPVHFQSDTQAALPFTPTRRVLLERLADRTETTTVTTQLYFTETTNGVERIVPGREFLDALAIPVAGSLVRTTSELTLGITATQQPFMVFKVQSFDAAFAGILDWEQTMSADLAPLFGDTVLRSYNPTARTVDQLTAPTFTDRVVENRDIRVLYDDAGVERITYSFPNPQTLIVTTDTATLTSLLPILR